MQIGIGCVYGEVCTYEQNHTQCQTGGTKTTVVAEYVTVARDHSTDAKILLDTSVRQPTERVEHTHQLSIRAAQSPTP